MRSLAEYEGGSYLPAGWHEVTVMGFEIEEIGQKSTPAVKVEFEDVNERIVKKAFYLTKDALCFLANFAVACGLTEAERTAYDVDDDRSHKVLVGRKVQVRVYKRDNKYSDVGDWAPIGASVTDTPADPRVDRSRQDPEESTPRSGVPF